MNICTRHSPHKIKCSFAGYLQNSLRSLCAAGANQYISMSTTAQRRLLKDLQRIQKEGGQEIIASPRQDNLLQWTASIEGIDKTPWEGGLYQLRMDFSENYPNRAPSVRFLTKMFHPNIYNDGRICLDMLQNQWSPVYDVWSILTAIRLLLADPNTLSPANHIASRLYQENKTEYERTVREIAEKSLDADLEINEDEFLKAAPKLEESPQVDRDEEIEGIIPRRRQSNLRFKAPPIQGQEEAIDSQDQDSLVRPVSPVQQVSTLFNNRANETLPPYRRNFLQISLPSYIRDLPIFNVDNSQPELQGSGSQEEGEVEEGEGVEEGERVEEGGEQAEQVELVEQGEQAEQAEQVEEIQEVFSEQDQSGNPNSEQNEPEPHD